MFADRKYVLEDFRYIIKCAYFDYQREKVFIRTSRNFKTINRLNVRNRRKRHRVNTTVSIEAEKCPACGSTRILKIKEMKQVVTDLKFWNGGVKRRVTRLIRWRYKCQKCEYSFSPEKIVVHSRKYGHSLLSWCVYLSTFSGLNMNRTCKFMQDVFNISMPDSKLSYAKADLSAKYEELSREILESLLKSTILHVDETFVNMRGKKGYVWVLTNLNKVYYLYRASREASFLRDLLAPFTGVLISDFYTAYDSMKCPQQKCLVHFIRDIDDDLLKNPCDRELKTIAQDFGILVRCIIETVDRYGLKRRHLTKHKKPALRFLQQISSQTFSSELANKYKGRFEKTGPKMFTFLDPDGVPWNNNNAEHAIKLFSK